MRALLAPSLVLAVACSTPTAAPLPPDLDVRLDGIEAVLDLRYASAAEAPEGWARADELARIERLYVALNALRVRIALAEAAPSVDDAAEIEADLQRLTEVVTEG